MNKVLFGRKAVAIEILLIGAVLFFAASWITDFHISEGIRAFPAAICWIAQNMVPKASSLAKLPKILSRLAEAVMLSIAVTMIATLLAFFTSLAGSRTTAWKKGAAGLVRMFAAVFRNIPDVVWAILLLFSFGQNAVTGFLTLFFTSYGILTRAFIETIDEVSQNCVEALKGTGADFLEIVFQGVIPSAMSGIMTWILYMIEMNIRNSVLIGLLTGSGIGAMFDLYYKRLEYGVTSLIIIAIIILVLTIEYITDRVRKVII